MTLQIISRALFISTLIFCTRTVCAQDIRIAVVGSMTGSLAEAGDEVKRGAELATKDINAAGGVNGRKIVLSIEDDACDPKQAVSVANHVRSRSPWWMVMSARAPQFLLRRSMRNMACS
jgi:branched-chain amino acid transport system substrate-binding protein